MIPLSTAEGPNVNPQRRQEIATRCEQTPINSRSRSGAESTKRRCMLNAATTVVAVSEASAAYAAA